MRRVALAILLVGCGDRASRPKDAGTRARPVPAGCERLAFADTIPVAEASGAAVTTLDGRAAILVHGDSGTGGAYVYLDAATGEELARGALPLGAGASDDLEGLALDGDLVVAITSSGWLRHWRRDGAGFALVDGPYPIGEPDPSLPSLSPLDLGSSADAFACAGETVNCGKNYEALCLVPRALRTADGCAGWAGSKSEGRLWCLVGDGDRYRADPTRAIDVVPSGLLTGCDVDGAGTIWASTNGLDNHVYAIRESVTAIEVATTGFPEAIAAGPDGAVYRFDDTASATSGAERWRCVPFSGAVPELRR